MATDAERNAVLRRVARELQLLKQRSILSSMDEMTRIVQGAAAELERRLVRTGSAIETARLLALREDLVAIMREMVRDGTGELRSSSTVLYLQGVDMADLPIEAGFQVDRGPFPAVTIEAVIGEPSLAPLDPVQRFLTNRMTDVGTKTLGRVNQHLANVIAGVTTPSDAITGIEQTMRVARARARAITNTELGRAFAAAKQTRDQQIIDSGLLPGLRKRWIHSGKPPGRARPSHRAAHGQVVDIDQPFNVGGVMLRFPRDPRAAPSETVNCGCDSAPHMDRWQLGGGLGRRVA